MSEKHQNDYLWDGSGEPDAEIARLEKALVQFRHAGAAPDWSAAAPSRRPASRIRDFRLWLGFALAAASAVTLFAVWREAKGRVDVAPSTLSAWEIESVAGTPRIGHTAIAKQSTPKLGIGQTVETDNQSRASIAHSTVGRVEIEPRTRLRLVESASSRTRLSLERGTIHAMIWASPGEFAVDTPSALAVDLGCAYTLHVDDNGAGLLRTTMGWVGFKFNGRDAFVPAGAVGETRPGVGPGTPYYEDASAEFRAALEKFDFEKTSRDQRSAQLATILAQARERDALTLWHLLSRTDGADRARVLDRLAALIPAPAGVTRDGILQLDQKMLDAWWNELGLGDISQWRFWERSWSEIKMKR
jgi:FecR-like protein